VDRSAQLAELFLVDDGSLPEIRVEGLDRQSVEAALDLIRGLAITAFKYAHELGPDAPLGLNHFVTTLRIGGVELPELGIWPFEDAVIVVYQMGPAWTAERIDGLFDLLHRICSLRHSAYAEIEPEADQELRRAFQKVWMQYLSEKGAA